MGNYTEYERVERGDRIRPIWMDISGLTSELRALDVVMEEDRIEIVGFSDARGDFSDEAVRHLRSWDVAFPIASERLQGDEASLPGEALAMAAKDLGGMDLLLMAGGRTLLQAKELLPELEEHLDTVVVSLGEAIEASEHHLLTTISVRYHEELGEILGMGHQQLLLHPNIRKELEVPQEWMSALRARIGEHEAEELLSKLLVCYLAIEPEAFVFEAHNVHIHHDPEEAGMLHFSDGDQILLARSVQSKAFFRWVQSRMCGISELG
ncbi:MAG: hypothetical protein SOR89_01750 [Ndongobacter sp.]|nr:hypothetical protein [Ndongobacter sp.]